MNLLGEERYSPIPGTVSYTNKDRDAAGQNNCYSLIVDIEMSTGWKRPDVGIVKPPRLNG
jgi:hypothetical protein